MGGSAHIPVSHTDVELLDSLIQVGVNLSAIPSRHQMLDLILREARKLARAEAGTLYVQRHGRLRFAAAQNDRLDLANIAHQHNAKTIVSGVEDARSLTVLWTACIDYVQGNFLQRPSPSIDTST